MSPFFVVWICLFALAGSIKANDDGNDDDSVTRGNEYIDQLLNHMFESDSDEYDPYKIDDSVVGFNKKVVFVNISGEAKLSDGTIKGLKTLHRSGDCSLHKEGEKLRVKADLGAGTLDFHYEGSAKFMNFGPTISVEGNLAYIEVHLEFTVDAKTGNNGKLTKFTIDDMRGMKVRVTGLGPITWAMNPVISGVTKIFKGFVKNFMENKVKRYIADHLPNYQFPVEGGGETESPLTKQPEPEETTRSEPETPAPEEPETPAPEEPETPAPEEPETPAPEDPETPAPEEPETSAPEEPETPAPEEPETPAPEEPETPAPEEPETPAPEEPETPAPEEPETPAPEEPEEP